VGSTRPTAIETESQLAQYAETVDVERLYEALSASGVAYGTSVRGLKTLLYDQRRGAALGELELAARSDDTDAYAVHPVLLDAAFHVISGLHANDTGVLPYAMDRWVVHRRARSVSKASVRVQSAVDGAVDISLFDAHGNILLEVRGLRARLAWSGRRCRPHQNAHSRQVDVGSW
jgi:hypothetical protein